MQLYGKSGHVKILGVTLDAGSRRSGMHMGELYRAALLHTRARGHICSSVMFDVAKTVAFTLTVPHWTSPTLYSVPTRRRTSADYNECRTRMLAWVALGPPVSQTASLAACFTTFTAWLPVDYRMKLKVAKLALCVGYSLFSSVSTRSLQSSDTNLN